MKFRVAGSAAEELPVRNPRGFDSSLPSCADTWHDTILVDISNHLRSVFSAAVFSAADDTDVVYS